MATFTIFVKMLTGKVIETHVSPSDTVRKLKEKIHDKAGIKPEEQRYIFAGKQLHDEQKLSECGLTKECIINLVPRIAGPAPAESSASTAAAAPAPPPVHSSVAAPRDAKPAEPKAEAKAQQHSKADEERAPQVRGMQKMQTKEGAEEAERRAHAQAKTEKEAREEAERRAEEAERRAHAQAKAEKEAERRAAEKTKEGAARRDAPATTSHVHTHTHTQTHTHTPAPTPSPTAAAATAPSSLPAMEVREVNDEQRRLLSRLVRLCESFNDSFDWPTYKEIKAIRATLVEQKVLDRSENE